LSRASAPGKIMRQPGEVGVRRSGILLVLALVSCGKTLDQLSTEQHKVDWAAANV
jgi:hypothetical protein